MKKAAKAAFSEIHFNRAAYWLTPSICAPMIAMACW